jgi:hypothetical protein
MLYFFRIGAMPANIAGVGSRGYCLCRKGKKVVMIWGRILMTRRYPPIFYWASPQLPYSKTKVFRTAALAHQFFTAKKEDKLRHIKGHS